MGRIVRWTAEEDALLRAKYPHMRTEDLARQLGRSLQATFLHAYKLGLRKSVEHLASEAGCRLQKMTSVGRESRFTKGQAAWNKGKKGVNGFSHTQFKRGELHGFAAQNVKPLGSYAIWDGILMVKVSTKSGPSLQRWKPVHRLIWEEANGPVPDGHLVIFRAGQHTTELHEITLDRVECVSLAENMKRNSTHRYPKEIADLIQLRGALNRQINKRAQHAND